MTFEETFANLCRELVEAGHSIIAGRLRLRQPDDPVHDKTRRWLREASDEDYEQWWEGDLELVAAAIDVEQQIVDEHQPVSELGLLLDVADELGVTDEQIGAGHEVVDRLSVWLDSFGDGRTVAGVPAAWHAKPTPQASFDLSDSPGADHPDIDAALPPQNAWLLLGSEASYPSNEDLSADHWMWTVPRQARPGDLVLIYFIAPRKAVHVVARVNTIPEYRDDIDVVADGRVDPHQWWAELFQPRAIVPIPYAVMQEACAGHLLLRGRPTSFLDRDVIARLKEARPDLEAVLPSPTGDPNLLDPAELSLGQWREVPTGPLLNERMVEQHIVEPLLRLALGEDAGCPRQVQLPVGRPDYVIEVGGVRCGVVEVKQRVRRGRAQTLFGSPDLSQLRRYMVHLNVPGMLIDVDHVYLVDAQSSEMHTFRREDVTDSDLQAIGLHLTGPQVQT